MSTILSRRNITVQNNIRRTESIEDMIVLLKTLNSTIEYPSIKHSVEDTICTDVFIRLWNQISNQSSLNRFIHTYSLTNWECKVNCNFIYIIDYKQRRHFTLHKLSNNECRLVTPKIYSEVYGVDTKFSNLCEIMKGIDGVEEEGPFTYTDSFKIDLNKL